MKLNRGYIIRVGELSRRAEALKDHLGKLKHKGHDLDGFKSSKGRAHDKTQWRLQQQLYHQWQGYASRHHATRFEWFHGYCWGAVRGFTEKIGGLTGKSSASFTKWSYDDMPDVLKKHIKREARKRADRETPKEQSLVHPVEAFSAAQDPLADPEPVLEDVQHVVSVKPHTDDVNYTIDPITLKKTRANQVNSEALKPTRKSIKVPTTNLAGKPVIAAASGGCGCSNKEHNHGHAMIDIDQNDISPSVDDAVHVDSIQPLKSPAAEVPQSSEVPVIPQIHGPVIIPVVDTNGSAPQSHPSIIDKESIVDMRSSPIVAPTPVADVQENASHISSTEFPSESTNGELDTSSLLAGLKVQGKYRDRTGDLQRLLKNSDVLAGDSHRPKPLYSGKLNNIPGKTASGEQGRRTASGTFRIVDASLERILPEDVRRMYQNKSGGSQKPPPISAHTQNALKTTKSYVGNDARKSVDSEKTALLSGILKVTKEDERRIDEELFKTSNAYNYSREQAIFKTPRSLDKNNFFTPIDRETRLTRRGVGMEYMIISPRVKVSLTKRNPRKKDKLLHVPEKMIYNAVQAFSDPGKALRKADRLLKRGYVCIGRKQDGSLVFQREYKRGPRFVWALLKYSLGAVGVGALVTIVVFADSSFVLI